MRRLIAAAMAALGGTLLLTSAVLFGSGITGMNHMLQPEPESEFVDPGPDGPPPALPTPTPTFVGSHDGNPFDVPPGTSAEDLAAAQTKFAQETIKSECMRENGFDYPVAPPFPPEGVKPRMQMWPPSIPPEQYDAAFLVMFGDTGAGADYHWQDAGCWGLAVHETGQDDVH